MTQPHVVIDTNCLLQILGAKSKYHFLFDSFLQFGYVLCISNEVLLEYKEILRMKASPLAADLFMKVIARSRNVIRKDPYFKWRIITKDLDDNKYETTIDNKLNKRKKHKINRNLHISR